jgi:opacity protein-like surface antigen
MKKVIIGAAMIALCLATGSAANAHHAVQAQFDVTKNVVITGKLLKVDWQNPHAWFHFEVTKADGTKETWSTETVGPNGLRRLGLSDRRLFQIGETYKVDFCPDRSGAKLGFTNAFWFPDGKFIKVGFPENPNGELPAN